MIIALVSIASVAPRAASVSHMLAYSRAVASAVVSAFRAAMAAFCSSRLPVRSDSRATSQVLADLDGADGAGCSDGLPWGSGSAVEAVQAALMGSARAMMVVAMRFMA